MAINITTITQLISDFRVLSQKDSISPESLGVLLQRLADLINSAASDADYKAIYELFRSLSPISQLFPPLFTNSNKVRQTATMF